MTCSSEELQTALDAYAANGNNVSEAARYLGMARNTFAHRLNRALESGLEPSGRPPPKADMGMHFKRVSSMRRNAEGLPEWYIMEPDRARNLASDIIDAVNRSAERIAVARPMPAPQKTEKLLTLIGFGDPHFGMRSWPAETGADWDTKLSKGVHLTFMDAILAECDPGDEAIIFCAGDNYHADNNTNMTPKSGHVLDVDTRTGQVFDVGADVCVGFIEAALLKFRSVRLIISRGNHDPVLSGCLATVLRHRYHQEPRVTIVPNFSDHIFHLWGRIGFHFAHGDKVRGERMPSVLASRRPDIWGASDWRYCLHGHLHNRQAYWSRDYARTMVISLPTLAAPDSYAAGHGYDSIRQATRITFHPSEGDVMWRPHKVPVDRFVYTE